MNGAELLQTLTHHHDTSIQAMPAIVLTARTGQEGDARVDGLLHGPVDYLLKVRSLSYDVQTNGLT